MRELIRIYLDDDNRLRCDCAYGVTDYQAVGLLESFKHNFMYRFVQGSKYEPHFDIGKDFDRELEQEEPL